MDIYQSKPIGYRLPTYLGHILGLLLLTIISYLFLDESLGILVHKTLNWNIYYAKIWAWLNHPYENKLNLLLMILITGWMLFDKENEDNITNKLKLFFTIIILMQIFRWINVKVFEPFFARPSPALIWNEIIYLGEFVTGVKFKRFSGLSFPSGHAVAMAYWAFVTMPLTKSKGKKIAIFLISLILNYNRFVAALHWLSDIIAGYLQAYIMFVLLVSFIMPLLYKYKIMKV
jgi:membrane-associated phospholipid phosphatase